MTPFKVCLTRGMWKLSYLPEDTRTAHFAGTSIDIVYPREIVHAWVLDLKLHCDTVMDWHDRCISS